MMPPLAFPATSLELKKKDQEIYVHCLVRKKWLMLTPEEWVRQHVLGFLIQYKGISPGLISVEKGLTYNHRKKRWDIVTFDVEGYPQILVECKRPEVQCTQDTMVQISAYQHVMQAKKLIVTNGLDCFVFSNGQWNSGIESV